MATQEALICINIPAAADLSTKQFLFVDMSATGANIPTGAGARAIGVLQNKPNALGVAATVAIGGVAKVLVGSGGVTAGDALQTDAAGAAITASSGDYVVGYARTTAAQNAYCEVILVSKHLNA